MAFTLLMSLYMQYIPLLIIHQLFQGTIKRKTHQGMSDVFSSSEGSGDVLRQVRVRS